MAAATAITPIDRTSGHFQQYTFTLASASIAAAGTEVNTVALPGSAVNDAVNVTPVTPAIQSGLIVNGARISAAGTLTFHIGNITAGALTPATTSYVVTLIRGTTMVYAR